MGLGASAALASRLPGLARSLARTRRARVGEPREGAGRRRGGGWTAKEGIRLPGRRGRPPDPCGHGAGTCRCGCSSAPSLSASLERGSLSALPAGCPRAGRRRPRLAAPANRPESPGQRPAPSRPCRPQDPTSIGPLSCQSAPKRRAGCSSASPDWSPRTVHANKTPPMSICTSAPV